MQSKVENELRALLSDLEENIDLEHVEKLEKLHLDAMSYKDIPYLPLTVIFPSDDKFKPYPYAEAFEDPGKMLFNELLWSFSSIYNSVKLKDHFPYHIRSNHGIGILNSLFGSKCRIVNDNMPWVDHLEDGIEGVKQLIKKGVPEFTTELGGRVLDTHRFYIDALKEYPKCSKAIRITQPDMQGPFDIAHLFLGTDIFYEMYDHPEILEELLDLITETYIGFRRFIDPYLTDKAGDDAMVIHGGIYGGKVLIKDDTALINLSRELYERFARPYNQRIFDELSGSVHYCGPERDWHYEVLAHPGLKSMQYGNPEMHDLEYDYKKWGQNNIPIVFWGYNQEYDFTKTVRELGIRTGMTLACKAGNYMDASEILKRHEEGGGGPL